MAGTYNLLFNASLMVENGLGYALGLDHILHFDDASPLCFRPVTNVFRVLGGREDIPHIRINLVWRHDRIMSRAARTLLDAVRKEIECETRV